MNANAGVRGAIERICTRRRWLFIGLFAFIPGALLGALVGDLLAGDTGSLVGFLVMGCGLLGTGVVHMSILHYTRCPRCDDYFFTGLLKASNPDLGGFGIFVRRTCVNCSLRLDASESSALD